MFFSDYVVIDKATSTVDPLGFMRPSSALADNLFRQFTVLCNHPAYHGFLCFAFQLLAENSITPASRDFSRRFRSVEVLWGILNLEAETSIINVNKYRKLELEALTRLSHLNAYRSLMEEHLSYGTLGHYYRPSISWGLLDSKGMHLTELGSVLAKGWSRRGKLDFADIARHWLADKAVLDSSEFTAAIPLFGLEASPSVDERKAWQQVLHVVCAKDAVSAPLWQTPLPQSVLDFADDPEFYQDFFPEVLRHYAKHSELCHRVELCRRFELLAGLVQFVFEWEYVRRLDEVREVGLLAPPVEKVVAGELHRQVREMIGETGTGSLWKPFLPLLDLATYREQAAAVLKHHAAHQKSKAAASFIDGDMVALRDKVKVQPFVDLLQDIAESPAALNRKVAWHYRRDWFIKKAALWIEYAGGAA